MDGVRVWAWALSDGHFGDSPVAIKPESARKRCGFILKPMPTTRKKGTAQMPPKTEAGCRYVSFWNIMMLGCTQLMILVFLIYEIPRCCQALTEDDLV